MRTSRLEAVTGRYEATIPCVTRAPEPETLNHDDLDLLVWTRQACVSGEARDLREDAKVSSVEAGQVVGVSHSAVLAWETATRLPQGDRALRYGRFLKVLQRRNQ
jgi:DNA-binding transcriptional regulator YiaG